MHIFNNTILDTLVTIGAVSALVIAGILVVIGVWKKGKDGNDDRLIKILQDTVTALETKVDAQKKEHDEILGGLNVKMTDLTKKVDDLEDENERLVEILQGRDRKTQEFYERALDSFKKVDGMSTAIADLTKALTEHFKTPTVINNVTAQKNV